MTSAEMLKTDSDRQSHYKIIRKLQFEYKSPSLSTKVDFELGKNPKPQDRFFIVSEIKRLSRPCARLVDLREFATNVDFQEFEWEGLRHIMDVSSQQEFIRLLKSYNNEYTFGVYEGVNQFFKASKAEIKSLQFSSDIDVDAIDLSECHSRNEERMNLGVKICALRLRKTWIDGLEDNVISKEVTDSALRNKKVLIAGNTSDISENGLRIRVGRSLESGEYLAVRFEGLEDEFMFNHKYIVYQVIKALKIDGSDSYSVSLKQLPLPHHDEFKLFTKRLVYSHKRRYKVSLDNTIGSVRSKMYEQFYMSRRNVLDVFVGESGDMPYALASDPAMKQYKWFVEGGVEYLSSLLKKDKVADAFSDKNDLYWLVLKNQDSKGGSSFGFYSTLLDSDLSIKFALYAMKTNRGKVFKVAKQCLDTKKAFVTSSLPRAVHKEMGDDSIYRYSPSLESIIDKLDISLSISEVTNGEMDLLGLNYSNITKGELSSCNQYLLKNVINQCELIRLESNEFRRDDRFKVNTQVTLNKGGQSIIGLSIDVSARGMAIKFEDGNIPFKKNDQVKLSLPELASVEKDYILDNMPYRILGIKENIVRVQIVKEKSQVGIHFWNKYISENIDELTMVGSSESLLGLRRSLRNLVIRGHHSVPAYFTVRDSRPCVKSVALSRSQKFHPIWSSAKDKDNIGEHLKSMFYHKAMFKRLILDLPKINQANPFINHFVLVTYEQTVTGLKIKKVLFLNKENPLFLLRTAIKRESGFCVFNVSLTKKSRPFDRFYRDELKYLDTYTPHKAKKILFEAKTLSGVLDFDDVTGLFKKLLNKVS